MNSKNLSFFGDLKDAVKEGLKKTSVGLNTPWGGISYGINGLTLNPAGTTTSSIETTQTNTGKRSYYFTTHAPPVKGYNNGVRVISAQVIDTAAQSVTGAGAFSAFPTTGLWAVNPDLIGGQLALDARNYNRYRFSQIVLEYIPAVAVGTTASGAITAMAQNLAIAFTSDSRAGTFGTVSYNTAQNIADNTVIPLWTRGGLVVSNLGPANTLYYTEDDSASSASARLTEQGAFYALWNTTPVGANSVSCGEFVLHTVLDLYDRAADYGFSITVDPSIGFEVLELLFLRYKELLRRKDRMRLLRHLSPPTLVKNDETTTELLTLIDHRSMDFESISPDEKKSIMKTLSGLDALRTPLLTPSSSSSFRPVEKNDRKG